MVNQNNMKQTFEQFIDDKCPGELETNNSPEGRERWVEQLDIQELIDFGQEYGEMVHKEGYIKGGIDTINEANRIASNPN